MPLSKIKQIFGITLKVLSVLLIVLFTVRSFLNDGFVYVINGGYYYRYYKVIDIFGSIVRWVHLIAICLIPTAAFFRSKLLAKYTIMFALLAFILDVVSFDAQMAYFLTKSARVTDVSSTFRYVEYISEIVVIGLFAVLYLFLYWRDIISAPALVKLIKSETKEERKTNVFRFLKELGRFLIILVFVILIAMPVYIPQSFFGFSNIQMARFTWKHLLYFLPTPVIFIVLYALFDHESHKNKEIIITFLTIFLFIHYNSIYLMDLYASRLPFQLCNIGSMFMLVLLIFRKTKLGQAFFDFAFIANIPGALIAFIFIDVKDLSLFSFWSVHYFLQHVWVMVIPLLLVAFKIYKFPKGGKAVLHFFIGFTIYFLICAGVGTMFNCFLYKDNDAFFNYCNYFYIFKNDVVNVLPFLSFTKKLAVTFKTRHPIYPIYMLFIYMMFSIYSLVCYLILDKLYKVACDHKQLHRLNKAYKEEMKNA